MFTKVSIGFWHGVAVSILKVSKLYRNACYNGVWDISYCHRTLHHGYDLEKFTRLCDQELRLNAAVHSLILSTLSIQNVAQLK